MTTSHLQHIYCAAVACDLTAIHAYILCHLSQHGTTRMGELRGQTNYGHAAMTGTVDAMEKQGLVKRSRSLKGQDRRYVLVSLTSKGREKLKGLEEKVNTEMS